MGSSIAHQSTRVGLEGHATVYWPQRKACQSLSPGHLVSLWIKPLLPTRPMVIAANPASQCLPSSPLKSAGVLALPVWISEVLPLFLP